MRSTQKMNTNAANARRRPFTWLPLLIFAIATLAFMAPATSHAAHVGTVTVGAPSASPIDAGSSATYVVTIVRGTGGGSSGPFSVAMSLTTSLPTGASFSFSPSTVSFSSADTSKTTTLTISATCAAPTASSASFTVKGLDASQSSSATGTGSVSIAADTTPPNFAGFPANIGPVNMDFNACGAIVTWTAPTANDNCGTPSLVQTAGLTSGSLFPAGTTTITYQATDTAGNVTNIHIQSSGDDQSGLACLAGDWVGTGWNQWVVAIYRYQCVVVSDALLSNPVSVVT